MPPSCVISSKQTGLLVQDRLVSLVAGYLLDANDEQKLGKGLPEEYKANLRKNVADAIGILSKLTTGIDVNVRFHDVKGFEFTDEIAIFDLLDISLVHGWLVDPQVQTHSSTHVCICINCCE